MTVSVNLPGRLRLKRTVKILRNLLLITISLLFGYTGCNNSYLLLTYLNGENLPSMPLTILPAAVTLDEGETFTFLAGGGSEPYTFSITYGDGLIVPDSGDYTASFSPLGVGIAHIQVYDGLNVAEAIVQIRDPGAAISISPSPLVSNVDVPVLMTAIGGTPPINWGTTSINSSSPMLPGAFATYTPTSTGVGMISVIDGDGRMVNIPVMVLEEP